MPELFLILHPSHNQMNKKIDIIRKSRLKMLEILGDLSARQMNQIPEGFNNNIIWNMGHLIAAQESVLYRRSGLSLNVEQDFFDAYKPGSRPENNLEAGEVEKIKSMLFSTLDLAEADLQRDAFRDYKNWTAHYGFDINSINDALSFLPFHEGLHLGAMLTYKRMLV